MSVYFDNSVVSAIAKRDMSDETEPILRVLRAAKAGRVRLMTSRVTDEEIARYAGDAKPTVEAIYLLMQDALYVERQKLLGMQVTIERYTCLNAPQVEDDPLWIELRGLGLKDLDAHHLMVAAK